MLVRLSMEMFEKKMHDLKESEMQQISYNSILAPRHLLRLMCPYNLT